MLSETLKCPICYSNYNTAENMPRILGQCGHTFCTRCLAIILKKGETRCPLDKKPSLFPNAKHTVEMFPINFTVKELIEHNADYEMCNEHDNKIDLVCMTDGCKLCIHCAYLSGHRDHDIKLINDIKPIIDKKKQALEDCLEKVESHYKDYMTIVDAKRQSARATIDGWFEDQITVLGLRKHEILYDADHFFNRKKQKLEEGCGKDSVLRNGVRGEISRFSDSAKKSNTFELLEEDISEFTKSFDSISPAEITQGLEKKLSEVSRKLITCFKNQPNVLAEATQLDHIFPQKDAEDGHFGEDITKDYFATPDILNQISIPSDMTIKNNILTLSCKISSPSYKVNLKELDNITETRICIDDTFSQQAPVLTIQPIVQRLSNLKSLRLHFCEESLLEDRLAGVNAAICAVSDRLEEVDICLSGVRVKDELPLIASLNRALNKVSNLRVLNLDFRWTAITSKTLSYLSKHVLANSKNLEKLGLRLSPKRICDESYFDLFVSLPSLKSLTLDLTSINLSHKSMNLLCHKTLPSMTRLEFLALEFSMSDLSDEHATELLSYLPNVKVLRLGFERTMVKDDSLKGFLEYKLPHLTKLKELAINLEQTQTSNELKNQVEEACQSFHVEENKERGQGRRPIIEDCVWYDNEFTESGVAYDDWAAYVDRIAHEDWIAHRD